MGLIVYPPEEMNLLCLLERKEGIEYTRSIFNLKEYMRIIFNPEKEHETRAFRKEESARRILEYNREFIINGLLKVTCDSSKFYPTSSHLPQEIGADEALSLLKRISDPYDFIKEREQELLKEAKLRWEKRTIKFRSICPDDVSSHRTYTGMYEVFRDHGIESHRLDIDNSIDIEVMGHRGYDFGKFIKRKHFRYGRLSLEFQVDAYARQNAEYQAHTNAREAARSGVMKGGKENEK